MNGENASSKIQSQLRADNFCHGRKIAELKALCEILKKNVDAEVLEKVEAQITQSYSRQNDEWWRCLLRFLSRVTDGKVWDEAVETVVYAVTGHRINRVEYKRQQRAKECR